MGLIFKLVPKCQNEVKDAGGYWLIEGGVVTQGRIPKKVADYSSVKRISCGTRPQKTAMLWITLFFPKGKTPQNITLHGSYYFSMKAGFGSVSAASSAFATHIGKQFKLIVNTLTIA